MKNNNYGKIINKSFIYMLALTIFICSAMLFLCNLEKNKVYADYSELQGDEVLNFNQLFNYNNASINGEYGYKNNAQGSWHLWSQTSGSAVFANLGVTISMYGNHKYYCYISSNTAAIQIAIGDFRYYYSAVYTGYNIESQDIYVRMQNSPGIDISFYIIDLTLMFGESFEPNTEQCKNLFTAEYYAYSTGMPLTLNTFSGYEQALQDIFSSYKYQLSMNALTLSTYSVDYKNEESSFDYNNNNWYFYNTFAVPLFTTLNAGATINIDYRFYVYDLSQAWFLNVMIYNGNEYITIYTSPEQVDTSREQNMSFTLPLDTDTLFFNIVYNNQINTDANAIVYKFNVSANQLDINSMIHNAFLSGQKDMSRQYQVGGDRYNEIYRQGVVDAESNGSVFDSSWSFVASAFSGIGDLLSTELMPNVPIGLFVALPLLLGLIYFIVKLTKGGS